MVSFDLKSNWTYFLIPIICLFGCIANLLSIIVLLNSKMKNISYKYILATNLSDLLYLSLNAYTFIIICTDCPLHSTYFTQWYDVYIVNYFQNCLAIFSIFITIYLSLIRYFKFKNKKYLKLIHYYLVIGILFLASLVYYFPFLFFNDIIQIHRNSSNNASLFVEYSSIKNTLGSSLYGTITKIILLAIYFILAIFILTFINIIIAIKFKKKYSIRFSNKVFHMTKSINMFIIVRVV